MDNVLEWIGAVPTDWEILKLRNIGVFSSSGIDKKINLNESIIKIVNYTDVYNNRKKELYNSDNYMKVSASDDKKLRHNLNKGDLLFTPSSETIEDIGQSAVVMENLNNTCFSYHLIRFVFNKNLNDEYKKYLCNNHFVYNYYSSVSTGTTRKTLDRNKFKETLIVLPPLKTQNKIASFLDSKCSIIDNEIEKNKKSIELMEEYRKKIIRDIFSEVAKKSRISKLKYLGKLQNGISTNSEKFGQGNCTFINYGDVYNNIIIPENPKGVVDLNEKEIATYSLKKGDVLFTRTSETINEIGLASVCTKDYEKSAFSGFVIRFRSYEPSEMIPDFYKYFFRLDNHRDYFAKEMNIVTRASLGQSLLGGMTVICPKKNIQVEMANYLDNKCYLIDKVIKYRKGLIERLEEYRKSLIYEAVTGKLEV